MPTSWLGVLCADNLHRLARSRCRVPAGLHGAQRLYLMCVVLCDDRAGKCACGAGAPSLAASLSHGHRCSRLSQPFFGTGPRSGTRRTTGTLWTATPRAPGFTSSGTGAQQSMREPPSPCDLLPACGATKRPASLPRVRPSHCACEADTRPSSQPTCSAPWHSPRTIVHIVPLRRRRTPS